MVSPIFAMDNIINELSSCLKHTQRRGSNESFVSYERKEVYLSGDCVDKIAQLIAGILPLPINFSYHLSCCGWDAPITVADYYYKQVEEEMAVKNKFLDFLRNLVIKKYVSFREVKAYNGEGGSFYKEKILEQSYLPIYNVLLSLQDSQVKFNCLIDSLYQLNLLDFPYRKETISCSVPGGSIQEERLKTVGEEIYECTAKHIKKLDISNLLSKSETAMKSFQLELYSKLSTQL